MDRPKLEILHVYHDEQKQTDVYVARVSERLYVCEYGFDGEAEVRRGGEFLPMPASIFDALIATLLDHPEMARAKYDGGKP